MNYEEGTQSDCSEDRSHQPYAHDDMDMADESIVPSIVKTSVAETQIFTHTIPLIGKVPMCKDPRDA